MNIKKSWLYWGAGILLLAALTLFLINREGNANLPDVLDVNLREHANLALHIHPIVQIEINGENYPLPENIGISQTGMRVIHTHEGDGTLHIESPYPYQFYLEDFFAIWGKRFTSECIFEYCEDQTHELSILVNGQESSLGPLTPLYDGDKVRIVYSEKKAAS